MNIRDLQYIVTVAELKHFAKAAEACYVSQPTLSMQIKKCEQELGLSLFERNNKQVLVNPQAKVIIDQAKAIIAAVQTLKETADAIQNPEGGLFRLGIIPSIAPYLLPCILESIKQHFPQLELTLIEDKTKHLLSMCEEGECDAVIIALPYDHIDTFKQYPLYDEPFLAAMHPDCPLSSKKSLDINDLNDQTILLLDEGHCLRTQALELCKIQTDNPYRASSLETIKHLIENKHGLSVFPKLAAHANNNVTFVPFKQNKMQRQVCLLTRKHYTRVELTERFAQLITSVISEHLD